MNFFENQTLYRKHAFNEVECNSREGALKTWYQLGKRWILHRMDRFC